MTRKIRIWLGWLFAILASMAIALIRVKIESVLVFILGASLLAIPVFFFWHPIRYRPFMKQKAQ